MSKDTRSWWVWQCYQCKFEAKEHSPTKMEKVYMAHRAEKHPKKEKQ